MPFIKILNSNVSIPTHAELDSAPVKYSKDWFYSYEISPYELDALIDLLTQRDIWAQKYNEYLNKITGK